MSRRSLSLSQVQRIRKASFWLGGIPIGAAFVVSAPYWADDSIGGTAIEAVGLVLIGLAVVGRTWCTLYIGGRKKREIVDIGPYSLSRNPLYVFSVMGALGIGLCAGSVILGLLLAGFTFAIFDLVVRQEESFLAERFGETYARFRSSTPRWLSWRARWRDADLLEVNPKLVLRTFRDASLMFLALPVIEAIEALQTYGHLPVLLHLP